jgi:hypothetical protein
MPEDGQAMAMMPGEQRSRYRLTVEGYHWIVEAGILGPDDRLEMIAGEVLELSPVRSLHAASVRALAASLGELAGPRAMVAVQSPLRLDAASEPQPDIASVRPLLSLVVSRSGMGG